MKLIFGTTNKRKVEDLQNIINEMNLDIQVVSMEDIGWDRGEIEENGSTIEDNSLIKAQAMNECYIKYQSTLHIFLYQLVTSSQGLTTRRIFLQREPIAN